MKNNYVNQNYLGHIIFPNDSKRYNSCTKSGCHSDKFWLLGPKQLVLFTLQVVKAINRRINGELPEITFNYSSELTILWLVTDYKTLTFNYNSATDTEYWFGAGPPNLQYNAIFQ